jgi:hypothetical protein
MTDTIEAKLVKTLTARRKPRILYHYTSGSGLICILESRSIWATNIRFLNDSTEYNFALNLARSAIQERIDKARNKFDLGLYTVLAERLAGNIQAEVYVSSFTENPDQLSQWRAYSPATGGYAVGFASKSLIPRGEEPNRFLARCAYDGDSQSDLISDLLQAVAGFAEDNARGNTQDGVFRESFKLLGRLLPRVAPLLKDHSFFEEQEWRLVGLATSFEHSPVRFRDGRSMLIPYQRHPFSARLPIEELVIGPTPHRELARDAAEAILLSNGLPSTKVRSSSIPYRTW